MTTFLKLNDLWLEQTLTKDQKKRITSIIASTTGWWQLKHFFIFIPTWGNDPI